MRQASLRVVAVVALGAIMTNWILSMQRKALPTTRAFRAGLGSMPLFIGPYLGPV